ncbi:unnamed protein product [Ophioblennius macclurei]
MLLHGTSWMLMVGVAAAAVFMEQHEANSVLHRWRRANTGFLEELKKGNLERECIEEICDYEEAREVFEDDDKTRQFWLTYDRRDPCQVNPCRNNGTCVHIGTSYECQCLEGFEGRYCQTVFEDSLKCLYQNGLCEHFCDGSGSKRRCFCADGYQLGEDGRQCVATVEFPCGQLPPPESQMDQSAAFDPRVVGSNYCPKGECPWQVLLQFNGRSHCGGALIHPEWVITAAHCLHGDNLQDLTVVAGEVNLDVDDGTEQRIPATMVMLHENYTRLTGDSDVGLVRLQHAVNLSRSALPVCLPTRDFVEQELLRTRYHSVSGWGRRTNGGNSDVTAVATSPALRKMSVPLMSNTDCARWSQLKLTDNMLCAGYPEGRQESCRGDDGGPLVTAFGSTHFLTGVVGWGRGCAHPGYYGVYANMAKFVDWVDGVLKSDQRVPPPPPLEQAHI